MGEREELYRLPREELLSGGHQGISGYGGTIAVRQALKALGPNTVIVVPASAVATVGGLNTSTAWRIPFVHSLFECAPAMATGIRAALEIKGKTGVTLVSFAGDAGSADIGFQSLSGAAERDEDIIHVCYDDEAYLNTGGQAGGTTPAGAQTVNTPQGKPTGKKDLLSIIEAHGAGYVASASIAFPLDFIAKLRKAKERKGFRYLHILTPNPATWGFAADQTIHIARLAVDCGLWPLFEVEDGGRRVTYAPVRRVPVADYIRAQGRFRHLTGDQIAAMQAQVDASAGGGR
ncbi:MAG: thiamine pyrophosphate-dependent enzyme [Bacteroidetes bacterium]|nr:thiamine pyrophosphate-dependent enzyme [Bacteroidota bacterium]MCL5026375.1 thiamine pyrophosphate-dependent enzyme [Chloroflexota bacterium]